MRYSDSDNYIAPEEKAEILSINKLWREIDGAGYASEMAAEWGDSYVVAGELLSLIAKLKSNPIVLTIALEEKVQELFKGYIERAV